LSASEIFDELDLGVTEKARPRLVMSDCPAEDEIAFMLVIPHTTTVRRIGWEFVCVKSFLNRGVFHLQQIQFVSLNRLETKLGALTSDELRAFRKTVGGISKILLVNATSSLIRIGLIRGLFSPKPEKIGNF
jgi:mRNA-degrading endonuclease toxin of MazEF toxin-antitoxin module